MKIEVLLIVGLLFSQVTYRAVLDNRGMYIYCEKENQQIVVIKSEGDLYTRANVRCEDVYRTSGYIKLEQLTKETQEEIRLLLNQENYNLLRRNINKEI